MTLQRDWEPSAYARFHDLRLRPALDLLAQVGPLPGEGGVIDLGCGAGVVAPALSALCPGRPLTGVDRSPAMLEEAEATGCYTRLVQADIGAWRPDAPAALIFANAVLNWVPDHDRVLPDLARCLLPGGVLAVQCPSQQEAPSHALLRQLSSALFPDLFDWSGWRDEVLDLAGYDSILAPLGQAVLWETTYAQSLGATAEGHPVRHFTASTAGRRILDRLDPAASQQFLSAYDAALEAAYPRRADGSVLFPFRRTFLVLRRPEA